MDNKYKIASTRNLNGEIYVPGDKSLSHRAILLASIATGTSQINGFLMGADNLATLEAMQQLGVPIVYIEDESIVRVRGVGMHGLSPAPEALNLGNSGTGVRLLSGLLSAQSFDSKLIGDASLSSRPMKRVVEPLRLMGAKITMTEKGTLPLKITGNQALSGIQYELPVASAQVKSSLLLAGLYAKGDTIIIELSPTRDHTENLLQAFGYPLEVRGSQIAIKGGGTLKAVNIDIPADISSAAFFIVAALITPGSSILLKNVGVNPRRKAVIDLLQAMGGDIKITNEKKHAFEPVADIQVTYSLLRGIEIPTDQVPLAIDEIPILMIAAACAKGKTILRRANELRVKETDRIEAIIAGLRNVGIQVESLPDGMVVEGGPIKGGEVDSYGDHRIAMAFAIAGCVARAPIVVHNCSNVKTSFPNFVELASEIGIRIEEIN